MMTTQGNSDMPFNDSCVSNYNVTFLTQLLNKRSHNCVVKVSYITILPANFSKNDRLVRAANGRNIFLTKLCTTVFFQYILMMKIEVLIIKVTQYAYFQNILRKHLKKFLHLLLGKNGLINFFCWF